MKNKTFFKKLVGILNCFAMLLVAQSANAACIFYFHQPEFPVEANKFKKVQ